MTGYIFVLIAGLAAGALSGIIGTGASIILLPLVVLQFGPQQAVPIMAVASVMGNIGKSLAWWREIDWRAFWAYSITGVPGAALGAGTLLVLPADIVEIMLGLFFFSMIPARRWMRARNFNLPLWQLAIAGGVIGFLTGIVLSTGPLSIPCLRRCWFGQGGVAVDRGRCIPRIDGQQSRDIPTTGRVAVAAISARFDHWRIDDGGDVHWQNDCRPHELKDV